MPQKCLECFKLLLEHLAWIEHQFVSGIRDSRKARSLWRMMRGVWGVRKSIHQSWLAKELGLGLLCWGFKGEFWVSGISPSPTPQCCSYRKKSLRVTLDYGHHLYLLFTYNLRDIKNIFHSERSQEPKNKQGFGHPPQKWQVKSRAVLCVLTIFSRYSRTKRWSITHCFNKTYTNFPARLR